MDYPEFIILVKYDGVKYNSESDSKNWIKSQHNGSEFEGQLVR